ncbi:MAG: thioredoxin family protein [Ginsengibacter sp.]
MNKNICIGIITLLLSSNIARSQAPKSIDFKNISFSEALTLAKESNKPIFIDCYTSWCAPCKKMDQTVFVNDTIYEFYNAQFVNLKIDMEKGEGVDLAKKYKVGSFPTYLFVDSKGEIIHRSASLMPVNEFLEEGKKALEPSTSYSALAKKYAEGDRSKELLLRYAVDLKRINRSESDKVALELMDKITGEDLHSEFGWKIIEEFSMSERDKPGKYLMSNKKYFVDLKGETQVQTVLNRLKMSDMYRLIRAKDSVQFFKNLQEMKQDNNELTQRNVAMLEMQYYLEVNNAALFVSAAQKAREGVLKMNDADLSFTARRALYMAAGNDKIKKEALELARQAVVLNPEEYSNQGTLGSICLEMKLKKEGLKAAKKARALADESTSKIQKIAQDLVDKIEAL